MKIKILLGISFILSVGLNAQINFSFAGAASAFTANVGATTIIPGSQDDLSSAVAPIGFTFNYKCVAYTQFKACSNGWMCLGNTAIPNNSANNLNNGVTGLGPILAPLWDDLATDVTGKVDYKLTGVTPNQVLTIEWLNMQWQASGTPAISFQVKLYETSNLIEYYYRQEAGAIFNNPLVSASIGLTGGVAGDFYSLNGTGVNPTSTYGVETNTLNVKPATGQKYTWTPSSMNITSSAVTQTVFTPVTRCDVDAQVIGIQMVVGGCATNPLNVTQFVLNMAGSTIPGTNTNDVTKIHIYYTGTSSVFAVASEFFVGGTVPNVGAITVNGSQALAIGTNYFWVTYDMNPATATIGNVIDGQCTAFTANASIVPVPTTVAGTRTIAICGPGGVSSGLAFWVKANVGTSSVVNNTTFSTWNDQSGNARNATQVTAANRPTYKNNAADNVNFNPVVDFLDAAQAAANADYMDVVSNNILPGTNQPYSVYAVIKPKVLTAPGKFLFSGIAGVDNFCAFDVRNPVGTALDSWNLDDMIIAGTWSTSFPVEFTFDYSLAGSLRTMYVSGLSVGTRAGTARTSSNTNSALGCQKSALLEFYNGSICEIATYPNLINSAASKNQIESYLAIKYGVTLGTPASPLSYTNTIGTTIWNGAFNTAYDKNIIGIARDDADGFTQRESKSTSTTSDILTMYIGAAKTTDQATNTGVFASGNNSFFMAGTDGNAIVETTYPQTPVPAGICCRLLRQWLSQRTNFTNADLKLEFDFTSVAASIGPLVAADFRLLIDDDGNFANATVVSTANASFAVAGSVVTCTVSGLVAGWPTAQPYFTLGSVATTTPLPVELANFAGSCINGFANLNWTTMSETNNSYFTVARSIDGIYFTNIGVVNGYGTTSQVHNYSFTDENPYAGTVYYRLSQTDFNGVTVVLSVISQTNCVSSNVVLVYPNPFSGNTTLHFSNEQDEVVYAEVLDPLGQQILVVSNSQTFEKGSHQLDINLDGFSNGMYLLRVVINGKTTVTRIIKQ